MFFVSNWTSPEYWLAVLYRVPAILFALSAHECAHAWAAYKAGDPTARNLGRITLDPTKHLDLFGTICLLLFGFGWAKPVPINSRNFKHGRKDNVWVSLSGILTNLLLSFVFSLVLYISVLGGATNAIYINILIPFIYINIALAVFNLIPIPPLDGFQFISGLFFRKAARAVNVLNRYGFIILVILMITGVIGTILGYVSGFLVNAYDGLFSLFAPDARGLLPYVLAFG
ncbi:MAG TPA: site-2 protease family protein [Clostridiales bacterium]|nr:site-2 protease family protein [Clostridiales bacterium]